MKSYLKLMRVHHYMKNFLVFAALACSGQIFDLEKLLNCFLGFLGFCFVSSIVYIINDISDKEKDKHHPTKCKRPIASGKVSIKKAWTLVAVLVVLASICNGLVFGIYSSLVLVLYFLLNLGYSFGLKNIPLVDLIILVTGFLLRVLYGALISDIVISNWLYLTVIAVAFYFALGKRRNELKKNDNAVKTRKVLKDYPMNFLDRNMYMCQALTNVFYALWCMDEKTMSFYNNKYLILTVPIVLLITMKYSMNIEGDSDGDPVEVLLHDKILLILCSTYLAAMFVILYLLG